MINIEKIEFLRDGGSLSYAVFSGEDKFFLRIVRPEINKTAFQSIDIHMYLQHNNFSIPKIILTNDKKFYILSEQNMYILYEYIDGGEPDADKDAESAGKLVGQLHKLMQGYSNKLTSHDKYFFIERYIEILKKMGYQNHKIQKFKEHGDFLWDKVKDLPRSYCHGDLYQSNIHKAVTGELYILDLDTSCNAFPVYDIALFCRATDYFNFNADGYEKTHERVSKFINGYKYYHFISAKELNAINYLLAVYHYQLQATIIEIYGLDCVDFEFLDNQYEWLMKWNAQCDEMLFAYQ